MKRIITAAAAVIALAGCGSSAVASDVPTPPACELASKIPKTTQADHSRWDIYPSDVLPSAIDHCVVEAYGQGQDIVATFRTDAERTTWAQKVAHQYGDIFGSDRVDGDRWTMITSGEHAENMPAAAAAMPGGRWVDGSK